MLICLPDDAVTAGYVKISEFQFAQVFRSQSKNFEGTEAQFLAAGHAYEYVQVDGHTRRVTIGGAE